MSGPEIAEIKRAIDRQGDMLQARMDSNHGKAIDEIMEIKVAVGEVRATLKERQGVCIEHARRLEALEGDRVETTGVGPAPLPPGDYRDNIIRYLMYALLLALGAGGAEGVKALLGL